MYGCSIRSAAQHSKQLCHEWSMQVTNMSSFDSINILNIRPLRTTPNWVSRLDSSSQVLGFCSQLWRWNR
jgi:hypothetical protein